MVIAAIIAISMLIPYQEEVEFTVMANPQNPSTCVAYIEPQKAQKLLQGMNVSIDVNGLIVEGNISSISEKRINGFRVVTIALPENDEITIGYELDANVVFSKKSWLDAILGR